MRETVTLRPRRAAGLCFVLAAAGSTAAAMTAEATGGAEGFLHGTVHTVGGREYAGLLRWADEEAFWDDLFNGTKSTLPHIDHLPEDRRKSREINILGLRFGYGWDEADRARQFIARFGDIREIVPRGGERVDVSMKSGTTYRLEGGSNDIGAAIRIEDAAVGRVDIAWDRIERIVFAAAPADLTTGVQRLFGDVETDGGTFRGFVQWDSQECLSTDTLDGESEDGEVALTMGRIRSIEKGGRNSSSVELKDGRKFRLHGTNDVDSSIRGIMVEDERYGRVTVSWDAFRRVEFRDAPTSGRGYAEYESAHPLSGVVSDTDGRTWKGGLVFDLDEAETFEMLNGERGGVEYTLSFDRVRSVAPNGDLTTDVKLKNGQELSLEDTQDVTEDNAGVLVLLQEGEEQYVPWKRVRRVDFD